jgi:hypothetical protein
MEAYVGADDTRKGLVGKPAKDGLSGIAGCSHGGGLSPETVVVVVSTEVWARWPLSFVNRTLLIYGLVASGATT